MAYDKVVDSSVLNAKLTAIADAVREKAGTTDAMTLTQIAEAIAAIQTGGGEPVVYGSMTLAETTTMVTPQYPFNTLDTCETGLGYMPKLFVIYTTQMATNTLYGAITAMGLNSTGKLTCSFFTIGQGPSVSSYETYGSTINYGTSIPAPTFDFASGEVPIYPYAKPSYIAAAVPYTWIAVGKVEM